MNVRRPLMLALVVVVVALAATSCRSDPPDEEPDPTVTGPVPTSVTTVPATTTTTTTTTTIPVVDILPADGRPRTPSVPATAEFEGLSAQPSFDELARAVVAEIERRYPGEEGSALRTETASEATGTGTGGTVLVRRHGFGDDSVAGYEYAVTVEQRAAEWVVRSATKQTICYRGVSGNLCT